MALYWPSRMRDRAVVGWLSSMAIAETMSILRGSFLFLAVATLCVAAPKPISVKVVVVTCSTVATTRRVSVFGGTAVDRVDRFGQSYFPRRAPQLLPAKLLRFFRLTG